MLASSGLSLSFELHKVLKKTLGPSSCWLQHMTGCFQVRTEANIHLFRPTIAEHGMQRALIGRSVLSHVNSNERGTIRFTRINHPIL